MTDPRQLTIDSGSFSPVDSYEDLFLASNESEPVMSIVGHYANPSDEAEDYGDELDWPEDQISPFQRPLFVSPRNAELFGASGASPKHLSTHFKLETDPVVKNLKELLTTLPSLESNEGEEGERDRVHEWALSRIVEAYEKQMETYARESDLKAQIQIMLELGNVYMKEGYFAEAFESYEKARIKAINGKQSSEQLAVIEAECLLSKGKSVMMLKQYTLTDSLLNEAEKILSLRELDEQSKFLLAEVKIQQGLMNVHMKKYSPAAEHLTVALTIVYDQTEKSYLPYHAV